MGDASGLETSQRGVAELTQGRTMARVVCRDHFQSHKQWIPLSETMLHTTSQEDEKVE